MDNKPMDITPKEREHLSRLRSRPGMFFGHRATITDLELYYFGMRSILIYHNLNSKICIIPDGFLEYLADKYDESANINWADILRSHESDEYTAFEKFCEHLNDYLAIYGYEPIEKIRDEKGLKNVSTSSLNFLSFEFFNNSELSPDIPPEPNKVSTKYHSPRIYIAFQQ